MLLGTAQVVRDREDLETVTPKRSLRSCDSHGQGGPGAGSRDRDRVLGENQGNLRGAWLMNCADRLQGYRALNTADMLSRDTLPTDLRLAKHKVSYFSSKSAMS